MFKLIKKLNISLERVGGRLRDENKCFESKAFNVFVSLPWCRKYDGSQLATRRLRFISREILNQTFENRSKYTLFCALSSVSFKISV